MEVKDSVSWILRDLLEKLFQSVCFRWELSTVAFLGSESRVQVNLVYTLKAMGVWKDDRVSDQRLDPPRLGSNVTGVKDCIGVVFNKEHDRAGTVICI